jgi:hypothetical protein
MSTFILLTAKGDVKAGLLGDIAKLGGVEAALSKSLKRAKAPELIGSWTWQKYKLFLYGYKEGRAGTENKHELPPPHDEILLFSDACLVASLEKSASKPAVFTVDQYKKFYNTKLGGFEDTGDGDGEAEEEEEDEEDGEEDEEEEDFDDEDAAADEEDLEEPVNHDEEDEEELDVRPTLRIKSSGGFKKIAKWMYAPELKAEDYPL